MCRRERVLDEETAWCGRNIGLLKLLCVDLSMMFENKLSMMRSTVPTTDRRLPCIKSLFAWPFEATNFFH